MGKVKITQKQADLIDIRIERGSKGMENMLAHHVVDSWTGAGYECLNALSVSDLARALYVGYEVEQEFKIGEWVVRNNDGIISQITNIDYSVNRHGGIFTDRYTGWFTSTCFRHATDEEIAREKTRRWWASHDRYVWGLKNGDRLSRRSKRVKYDEYDFIGMTDDGFYRLSSVEINNVDDFSLEELYYFGFVVVCFKEDRKDIN